MWFPALWLTLGFFLKWTREAWQRFINFFDKRMMTKMFDLLYTVLSFILLLVLVGYFKVTLGILFVCLLFWVTVCAMVKSN